MANIRADKKFANNAKNVTENIDKNIPKLNAWSEVILPLGIGLVEVLFIIESMSESHHIFNEPEAPAPNAIHTIDPKAINGFNGIGAIIIATPAVKIAKRITLIFKSSR